METDLPDFKRIAAIARKRKQRLIALAFIVIVLFICSGVSAFYFLLPAFRDQAKPSGHYKEDPVRILTNDKLADDVVVQEPLGSEISRKRRGMVGSQNAPRRRGPSRTDLPQTRTATRPFEPTIVDTVRCQSTGSQGAPGQNADCSRTFILRCPSERGRNGASGRDNGRGRNGQLGARGSLGGDTTVVNNGAPGGFTCETGRNRGRDTGRGRGRDTGRGRGRDTGRGRGRDTGRGRDGGGDGSSGGPGCERVPVIDCNGRFGAPGQDGSDGRTGAPGQPDRVETGATSGPRGPGGQSRGLRQP